MRYLNLISNINNWWDYLLFKYHIKRPELLTFKCKNGITAEVPARMLHTFKEIFFDETYTKYLPSKILNNGNPLTIVDIGANTGFFSLFMLSRFPTARVIAFEPIPVNFDLLTRNKKMNAECNLEIHNKAVYGESRKVTLKYDASDSFSTAASVFENKIGSDEIEVDTITLPEVFEKYKLDSIDLLKLDCEGSEYNILYNCPEKTLDDIKAIAMESHPGEAENENKQALIRFLNNKGFEVRTNKGSKIWAWVD